MASLFSSCAAFASAACCAASAPNRSASLPACAISAWAGSWGSWGSNGDPMGTQGDGGDGLEFLRGNLWKSGGTRSYHKIMKTWCVFMWFMWLTPLTPFKMEHGWHGQLLTTKGAMVHEQTKVFGLVAQMNLKTKKSEKFSYTSIFRNIWPKTSTKNIDADARFPGAADVGPSTSSNWARWKNMVSVHLWYIFLPVDLQITKFCK